jgi:hypothetical protein
MVQQTRRLTEDDGILLLEDAVQQRLRLRVRREVVAFLADLADASRPDRAAGVVAFNPLIDYPEGTVGSRLKAIITGLGEGQPWADVDALLDDLVGKIDLTQLHSNLQATIDLITADAATTNSVNARLASEAQDRALALLGEAQARATAISNAIGDLQTTLVAAYQAGDSTVNSRITTEVGLSQDRDSALGVRIDTVTSRLNVGGDVYSAIATAQSYAYTKAQTDSAVAASANTLAAAYQGADGTLNTRITNESTASSNRDTALGTRIDTVTARLDTGDIATSLATLATYAYTKAQTDSAIASTATTLRSEYSPISARLNAGGDIYNSLATANSYAYTKAATDSALTSLGNTLTSSFSNADNAISARLNAGGDIYTSLATANTYAYTKAQSDSALSSMSTSLTSAFTAGDNAIKARLDTGDIATALASAQTYAYTKAQTDSAIASTATTLRSEYNPINARLNAGGDVYNSLATALSYAYTKAQSDSATASLATTLRSEYNGPLSSLSSSVTTLQTAVSGTNGLQAQYALKTVATRSDGKPVVGYIGLASTAPNSGAGASELILQADRIYLVPSSDVNASPAEMMVLGTVNGVTTLVVPASRIGDLSVGTLKIADHAVTVPLGAGLTADWSSTATYAEQTLLYAGTVDTGGAPLLLIAVLQYSTTGPSFGGSVEVRLKVNGSTVATMTPFMAPSIPIDSFCVCAPLISSPGSGAIPISLVAYSTGGSFTAHAGTSVLALGVKK